MHNVKTNIAYFKFYNTIKCFKENKCPISYICPKK